MGLAQVALASIDMADTVIGWAQSPAGRVLRTTDGTRTWTDVTPRAATAAAPSSVNGLAAFAGGSTAWYLDLTTYRVYGASDGGAAWAPLGAVQPRIPTDGGIVLDFADSRHGWIEVMSGVHHNRGEIFATSDDGRTWQAVYEGDVAGDLRFTDPDHGWLSTGAVLNRTEDGGRTWNPVALPGGAPSWVSLPTPFGTKLLLAAMREGAGGPRLLLFRSDRTGASWEEIFAQTVRETSTVALSVADERHAWVALADGSAGWRTEDGGSHWKRFSTPGTVAEMQGFQVVQLDFVSPDVGWMVAQERKSFAKALFFTDDGGASWMRVTPASRDSR
ncbi:MAG: hypothetical protein IMW98_04640 [Firmicutes bacterium]|nr:hypothetical protein [Bacillota bacterium]